MQNRENELHSECVVFHVSAQLLLDSRDYVSHNQTFANREQVSALV